MNIDNNEECEVMEMNFEEFVEEIMHTDFEELFTKLNKDTYEQGNME